MTWRVRHAWVIGQRNGCTSIARCCCHIDGWCCSRARGCWFAIKVTANQGGSTYNILKRTRMEHRTTVIMNNLLGTWRRWVTENLKDVALSIRAGWSIVTRNIFQVQKKIGRQWYSLEICHQKKLSEWFNNIQDKSVNMVTRNKNTGTNPTTWKVTSAMPVVWEELGTSIVVANVLDCPSWDRIYRFQQGGRDPGGWKDHSTGVLSWTRAWVLGSESDTVAETAGRRRIIMLQK
jgi:hypothetical protein